MVTTFGWERRAIARASCRILFRTASPVLEEEMNFTATGLSSSVSCARKTWPVAPRPIGRTRRYSSNSCGGVQPESRIATPLGGLARRRSPSASLPSKYDALDRRKLYGYRVSLERISPVFVQYALRCVI